jgi:hypothetical protein
MSARASQRSSLADAVGTVPEARVTLIDREMTSWYGRRAIQGLACLAAVT